MTSAVRNKYPRIKRRAAYAMIYTLLIFGGTVMVYPFLFMVLGALTSYEEYHTLKFLPIPKAFSWARLKNFVYFFQGDRTLPAVLIALARFVWYSAVIGLTSLLAGYVFAKLEFRGKKAVFISLMISLMIPAVAWTVPIYVMMARFPLAGGNNIIGQGGKGFIDGWPVLFILSCVSPYNFFLFRQSMVDIPNDFEEAAQIDGARFIQILAHVYAPMLYPVFGVVFIGMFIGQWNDFMFPMIYAGNNPKIAPIGLYITTLLNAFGLDSPYAPPNYPAIFGISLIFILPPILVFVLIQDMFVSGMTMGGIKS